MSEQQPEGVDERLERGLSDEQTRLAGADAGADADPARDQEEFRRVVQREAEIRDEPQ